MLNESWKFRCQQQRFAEPDAKSTGQPVAFWIVVRQINYARIVEADGSVWKDLFTRIMKIT